MPVTTSDQAKLAEISSGDLVQSIDAAPADGASKRFLRSTKPNYDINDDDGDDDDEEEEERGRPLFGTKLLDEALEDTGNRKHSVR
ncbi:hypothetical protein BBP00_00007870 [Phytophthora kernoviae]|uniref:RxLR effector protein n=1 Tax=Phytophthora kernoviae TaxID=325452 RepID=A0A3F2RJ17_9STRA|nr:hypothetical protein BBP00_00007870 [Phytophthora kernoviae]